MYKVETIWDKDWDIVIPEYELYLHYSNYYDEDINFKLIVGNTQLGIEMSFKEKVDENPFPNLFFNAVIDISDIYNNGNADVYLDQENKAYELLMSSSAYDEIGKRIKKEIDKVIPLFGQFKEAYNK